MRLVTVGLSCIQGEVQREGAAASRLAVDADEAAVSAHHVVDNREPQAGPLRSRAGVGLNPEEFAEDLPLHPRRDADAVIADANDAVAVGARNLHLDVAALR